MKVVTDSAHVPARDRGVWIPNVGWQHLAAALCLQAVGIGSSGLQHCSFELR